MALSKVIAFRRIIQTSYNHKITQMCPPFLRFLFEVLDDTQSKVTRRILYTGDFRFESQPLTSLRSLHLNGAPLTFDELHLDTTFAHPEYDTFPSRDEAIRAVWEIVSGWIKKNGMYRMHRNKHVVLFHLPGNLTLALTLS